MSILRNLSICLLISLASNAYGDGIPGDCTQLILAIAPTWNSMRGELRLFERAHGGDWVSVAGPFPVLFGKNGVAWARGWLDKMNRVFESKSEMAARLREFSKSVRSSDTIRTCLREVIIHIIKSLRQTFGAMTRAHRITTGIS